MKEELYRARTVIMQLVQAQSGRRPVYILPIRVIEYIQRGCPTASMPTWTKECEYAYSVLDDVFI